MNLYQEVALSIEKVGDPGLSNNNYYYNQLIIMINWGLY